MKNGGLKTYILAGHTGKIIGITVIYATKNIINKSDIIFCCNPKVTRGLPSQVKGARFRV